MPSKNGSSSAYVSIGEASRILNCHPNSLRVWSSPQQAKIPVYRMGSKGQRRYLLSDLYQFLGVEQETEDSQLLIYARVSTNDQAKGFSSGEESSLSRQIDRLKEFAKENYSVKPKLYWDVGSGVNYQRKNFVKMMDQILSGKFDNATLLVEWKDRLSRFSVDFIQQVLAAHKINLVFTQSQPDISNEAELTQDLLSILTIFTARTNGRRGSAALTKHLSVEAIQKIRQLHRSGLSYQKVADRMNELGYISEDGSPISTSMCRKHCNAELKLVQTKNRSNVETFITDCCEVAPDECRVFAKVAYAEYEKWAKNENLPVVSTTIFGRVMSSHFRKALGRDLNKRTANGAIWKGRTYCGFKIIGKELHYTVKPQKKEKSAPKVEEDNTFVRFYHECLKGKYAGHRKKMDNYYISWCRENNLKPIVRINIPQILLSISRKNIPICKNGGTWYDFT